MHDEVLSPKLSCQVMPLHMAAQGGHLNVVEYFVENDAEIDVKENTGVSIQIYFISVWSFHC